MNINHTNLFINQILLALASDGVMEYDVHIKQTLIPKKKLEYIKIDFTILPTKK